MGLLDFFKSLFKSQSNSQASLNIPSTPSPEMIASQIQICEAAFHACTNLVANAVSNCTVKQFKNDKPERGGWWYKLNYRPNANQSATAFWQKLIHRLYEDNEALVVQVRNQLFVADAFVKNDLQAFNEHTYTGVMINNLQLDRTFRESEVWYFKLHDRDVKALSDQITLLYGQLILAFVSSYTKSRGSKGVLKIEQIAENQPGFTKKLQDMINEDFKTFYSAQDAVIPLYAGFDYEQLVHDTGPAQSSKELHDQIQSVFETYAMAFGIPKHLITGEVQDTTEAIEYFLTFTLDPLVKMLETEINSKDFGEGVRKGNYIRFKTNEIKHIDILTVAANIEKLISSGAMTINEVRKASGMDRIEKEFADRHVMTKNFADVDDVTRSLERRDKDENRDSAGRSDGTKTGNENDG